MPTLRHPCHRFLAIALSLLATAPALLAETPDEAFERVTTTIMCDCGCSPQTIKACVCGRAAEMEREVAGMIQSGQSSDEIIAHYVALNGPQIRIEPTARGFNLVAWAGPLVGLVVASVLLGLWIVRSRRAPQLAAAGMPLDAELPPDEGSEPAAADEAASDREGYERRLRRQLEDWD